MISLTVFSRSRSPGPTTWSSIHEVLSTAPRADFFPDRRRAFEAKTHLAALLDAVSAGEQITITRHGRPVARLVPPAAEAPASVVDTIARLRQFSQGQSLGGISIAELRDQDRR